MKRYKTINPHITVFTVNYQFFWEAQLYPKHSHLQYTMTNHTLQPVRALNYQPTARLISTSKETKIKWNYLKWRFSEEFFYPIGAKYTAEWRKSTNGKFILLCICEFCYVSGIFNFTNVIIYYFFTILVRILCYAIRIFHFINLIIYVMQ